VKLKYLAYAAPVGLMLLAGKVKKGIVSGIKVKRVSPYATTWTVTATIKNTGNTTHTFTTGCSAGAPGGGTGCDLWLDSPSIDLPTQDVTIDPGATATVTWTFSDSPLNAGTNWVTVKVWSDSTLTNCLDGDYTTFNVAEIVSAEITSISITK